MKLTSYNISTSWIGGTFNEAEVEKRFQGFKVPAVISYGIMKADDSYILKFLRKFGSRSSRLPFEQLFYDDDNKRLIYEKDFQEQQNDDKHPNYPSYMKEFLAALRSGPSVLNQQSWRFVLSGNSVHLFDVVCNNYSQFDNGIALANLYLLKEIRGGKCNFEIKDPAPNVSPLKGKYVILSNSWINFIDFIDLLAKNSCFINCCYKINCLALFFRSDFDMDSKSFTIIFSNKSSQARIWNFQFFAHFGKMKVLKILNFFRSFFFLLV